MGLVGVGAFLILEHIYTYGSINLFDILGHEWMGIALIIIGSLTAHKWGSSFKDELENTKNKIRYIFGKNE